MMRCRVRPRCCWREARRRRRTHPNPGPVGTRTSCRAPRPAPVSLPGYLDPRRDRRALPNEEAVLAAEVAVELRVRDAVEEHLDRDPGLEPHEVRAEAQ